MSMYICIHSAAPKYMHINTCTGVPFRAADSANRRGRFPRGAGRLVVSARDWAHVRARLAAGALPGAALDYFENEFRRG